MKHHYLIHAIIQTFLEGNVDYFLELYQENYPSMSQIDKLIPHSNDVRVASITKMTEEEYKQFNS